MPPEPQSSPTGFLPLHPLEYRILLILLGGPSHGYAVVQEIEDREANLGTIYPANLYRRIRDLLSRGLLEDADPPESELEDSRRRYFRLTEMGRAVVEAETGRLRNLLEEARDRGLLTAEA